MGEPCCGVCELMGYRSCDVCASGLVFQPDGSGVDICEMCVESSPTWSPPAIEGEQPASGA